MNPLRFPRVTSEPPQANRMLVTKAFPQDVAILAFVPLISPAGSHFCPGVFVDSFRYVRIQSDAFHPWLRAKDHESFLWIFVRCKIRTNDSAEQYKRDNENHGLNIRQESIFTITAFTAIGKLVLKDALNVGLDAGLTKNEKLNC